MTEHQISEALLEVFSKPRLDGYRHAGESYEQAFERYQDNIRLSASLMPALHYLEVILRNRLDMAIRRVYGEHWLLHLPSALPIEHYNLEKLMAAREAFHFEKRCVPTQDDMVATMTFGFWCALFHKRYDPALWHRGHFFPTVFPNWPREQRKRGIIQPKLYIIKDLRNRIAHHEPIGDWKPGAIIGHRLCLELIGAMSPEALERLREVDRFAGA